MSIPGLMHATRMRRPTVWLGLPAAMLAAVGLALPGAAFALTTLSQGFYASGEIPTGSLVSLEDDSSDRIAAASTGNVNNLLGVVINDNSSLLSLSNRQAGQVQVATSGIAQALVSDINGAVAEGDQITASPISGVGMKATGNTKIIGTAQAGLEQTNGNVETYTDKDGRKQTVMLGEIPVHLNVAYYYKQPEKTIIPQTIQNVANALAGREVSALPIIISLAIFIVSLGTVVSIVYSMIHSSIISVGRNPMSQSAIYRNLIQLSALVAAILGATVVAIYLVLTRL